MQFTQDNHQLQHLTTFIFHELVQHDFEPYPYPHNKANQLQKLESEIHNAQKIADLSLDAQTLFNFACFIVDIKYKHKYGKQFEWHDGKGYTMNTKTDENSELEGLT